METIYREQKLLWNQTNFKIIVYLLLSLNFIYEKKNNKTCLHLIF